MNFTQTIKREIKLFTGYKTLFKFAVLAPLLLCGLMVAIFWNGVMRNIPVSLVDNDKSRLSGEFISMVRASPYIFIAYTPGDENKALSLIHSGKTNGMIVIPENFERDILAGKQTSIAARYNNQFLSQGGTLNKAFAEVISTFAAKYDAAKFFSMGVDPSAVLGLVAPIMVSNHILYNPSLDYSWFLLIGILPVLWQLCCIGVVVHMFGVEFAIKDDAVLKTLNTDGGTFFMAKFFFYTVLYSIQFTGVLLLIFFVAGTPLNGPILPVAAGSFLFVTATVSVGILIISAVKKIVTGISASSVYVSPAFAYAGVTFPYEAMPKAAQIWSNLIPVSHLHKLFINMALRNAPLATAVSPFTALLLFTVLALPAAFYLFKRRATGAQ